jgi:hypothetical protein
MQGLCQPIEEHLRVHHVYALPLKYICFEKGIHQLANISLK